MAKSFETAETDQAEVEAAIESAVNELGADAGVDRITEAVERILRRSGGGSAPRSAQSAPSAAPGSGGGRASRTGTSTSPSTTTIPQPAAGVVNRSRAPNSPNTASRGNTTAASSRATASGSPQISYLSPSTSRGNRFSHEPRGDYSPASGSGGATSCNKLILTAAGDITEQRRRELIDYLESQQCRVTGADTSMEGSTGTVIARVDVCECPLPLAELKRHLEDLGVRMGIMVGLQTEELFNYIHRL